MSKKKPKDRVLGRLFAKEACDRSAKTAKHCRDGCVNGSDEWKKWDKEYRYWKAQKKDCG